jgi:hypothetical protein
MADDYQYFRSRGELVRVKLTSHPSTATARYVFWGDLRMCFPGIVRIQHNDIFVPFMRGRKEYRYGRFKALNANSSHLSFSLPLRIIYLLFHIQSCQTRIPKRKL